MWRIIAFLLLLVHPAFAQLAAKGGGCQPVVCVAFKGVTDYDANVVHFWGLTAAGSVAANAGGTAADLCDSGVSCVAGVNACLGVKVLANGALDVSSGLYCANGSVTVTNWCSGAATCTHGGTAHIITLYDQVGAANQTGAYTTAPGFVLSGFNSKPVADCLRANNQTMTATISSISPPYSMGITFEQWNNTATNSVFESGTAGTSLGNNSTANTAALIGSPPITATATNGSSASDFTHGHAIVGATNTATNTSSMYLDGAAAVTGTFSPVVATGTTFNFCSGPATNFSTIYVGKAWISNVLVTGTVGQAVTNLTTIPLP